MPTHPRGTQKIPSPGCKRLHGFKSDVSPSSRQAAQIFQKKGAKGVTQLQNTKLLVMGGLGNKRGILGGHEAAERGKGIFKKKPGGDQAAGRRKRRNRAGSRRDAPSGTCWDRSPTKAEKTELHSPNKRGGGGGRGGDAGGDHCHLRLAGTDPAKPNGGCTGLGSRCLSVVPAQISISN